MLRYHHPSKNRCPSHDRTKFEFQAKVNAPVTQTKAGFRLGNWVAARRSDYTKERLTEDRIDALNALGCSWDPIAEACQEGLGCLKTYRAKHGHCRMSGSFKTKDGFKLGSWVAWRTVGARGWLGTNTPARDYRQGVRTSQELTLPSSG